jgi:hypothetical protein
VSNEFRVRHFDEESTKSFLKGAIRPEISVPFFGAGFSAGERARNSRVPFGSEWLTIMREQISASTSHEKPTNDELLEMKFQDVSDIYFSDGFVSLENVKRTLDDNFSTVIIQNASKKRLLNIEWPYVYTLNIDDGIERAINGIKILPYREFSRLKHRRFVYKLHGDIDDLLAAPSHLEMAAIFGRKQYIAGLDKNQAMLADLANDFAEKNLLFIGCSLSDEIDVLLALDRAERSKVGGKGARIFVCSTEPTSFIDKKKMRDYGITDVIVVPDYSSFYSFLADAVDQEVESTPLTAYEYVETQALSWSKDAQIRYLTQAGWRGDPYNVSISRRLETQIRSALADQPLIAVWGRRVSGRTSLLYRVLNENKTRIRYFITSSTTVSDNLFNAILRAQNSLIAIDTNALSTEQIGQLSEQTHRISENNTGIVITMDRSGLNSLGRSFDYQKSVFELKQRLGKPEAALIDRKMSPLGYMKWAQQNTILDNMFVIASSPISTSITKDGSSLITKLDSLCAKWKISDSSKLTFMVLYYLTVRHHMPSKSIRALAKAQGQNYMGDVLLENTPTDWQPFVEREASDLSSRVAENSETQLVSNSFVWLRQVVRSVSEKVGAEQSAYLIAGLYSAIKDVDNNAFELVLYDNLNAVYEPNHGASDWRGLAIRQVYEHLGSSLAESPNYWLQRAKAIYYISNEPDELRIAAAFCEKGIVERASEKTWSNAQLTRANIYGKLCSITNYKQDEDILVAVRAYSDVISKSYLNPVYIEELLRKSKNGEHYMSMLCKVAGARASLLSARESVRTLQAYMDRR